MCQSEDMARAATATLLAHARERPARRISLWRTPRTRALLLVGTLGAITGVGFLAACFYTDLLWYDEVGQGAVFWTTLRWKVLTQAFVGLGTTCFVLLNLAVAERRTRGFPARRRALLRHARLLYPGIAVACGLAAMDARPDDSWKLLLLWANRTDFGTTDPLFHRDAGFFVFSLPLYQEIARWLFEVLVATGVLTAAAYAVAGRLRAARPHLLGLAALTLAVVAWRTRLAELALALPHGRVVPGATHTDALVLLPATRVLALVTAVCAVSCLYAAVRRRVPLLPVVAVAAIAALAVIARSELPGLIDRFDVQPQQLARERPYVGHAIAATQRAFGLDRVTVRPVSAGFPLSAADLRANRATIDNVPLWDTSVLRPAMNELESIGRYYAFPSLTVNRFEIDGQTRVLTVAARELDRERLDPGDRSWATDRFAYTHGHGLVAVQGSAVDAERQPAFAQRGFGAAPNPLRLTQPRIYFGQQPGSDPPYLVVDTGRAEVDAPTPGSQEPRYHYHGTGGIPLSSMLRRAAFAARFGDLTLLLTETVKSGSRMVLHRNAGERLRTLAPFLRWSSRPQTTVVGGHVQYIFHGYTTSTHYPYSEPIRVGSDEVNYMRAPVVAAVDAFDGHVAIYVTDPHEPIMRAWRAAYPSLFLPAERMPGELRAQLRYPRRLFRAQAEAYTTYHADDTTAFWNRADAWQVPLELAGPIEDVGEIRFPDAEDRLDPDERREGHAVPDGWQMQPDYLLARLPGDLTERFMLATPFAPRGGENLVAFLAGSIDARGAPSLSSLSLPRDQPALGPSQAARRILANTGISKRLELLNRESRDLGKNAVNRTVLGSGRIVPIAGALVYVQPLYLTAAGSGVPRLQLVTVVANGRVGYGQTLYAALRRTL
jgi:uncharacterized protein